MSIYLDKIIDKDLIKDNSVIVIKFKNDGYQDFEKVANQIGETMKDKKGCFIIFLHDSQSIDLISEEEMNKFGWYKKKE